MSKYDDPPPPLRKRGLLSINPEPLKIVDASVRDVWQPKPRGWRCYHEDGRGQCSSRETKPYGNWPDTEWLCERHAPKAEDRAGE